VSDIFKSADFQCDQTEGFPVSLCVDWDTNKAWLELNTSLVDDDYDATPYEKLCKDWGERNCFSEEDFNNLLQELGDEAYENAAFNLDEDDGMGLQL
jgi:hypothetical protein